MRLRRLMGVADQIVASRFSSIDLSNKALKYKQPEKEAYEKFYSSYEELIKLMRVELAVA
ncbi:hypothetical protein VA208B3_13840 [Vibrio alginolyticus]|nr:hypothetical protein VA208B3_13840 [Vibrio alginolyticus]